MKPRILVPYDFSTYSERALAWAADLQRGLERSMRQAALRNGSQASVVVRILARPVGDTILDAARDMGAELIVMGTHGRSGARRVILGSVAENVLRQAQCPVVTLHAAGDGDGRLAP